MDNKDIYIKRKTVSLTLTENCNLNCIYCYERAKTKQVMNIQVAKEIIKYEFHNSEGFEEIKIDLFGGEPTLCIDLVKELVEWTRSQDFSKPHFFFMVTNGTLIHDKTKEWLYKNKEYVKVGLSLDGTRETHNTNRSSSYDNIDIDFFSKTFPAVSVRMTISNNTICHLSEDVIHLHNLGFNEVIATFACGINWDSEKVKTFLADELKKLCDFYLKNPEIKECSIFDMYLPDILDKEKKLGKWCGCGTNVVSYGFDGSMYPCQTFQQNTTVDKKPIKFSEIDFVSITDFSDSECSNCIIEPICPNCYGMNYASNGNIFTRDKQLCDIVKIRALAVSYLRAKKIKDLEKMKPNEVYQTILAINAIQNEF